MAQTTVINPVFERTDAPQFHLNKIVNTTDTTYLHFKCYVNNGWVSISDKSYIEDMITGKRYPILKSEGIPLSPEKIVLSGISVLDVTLCFHRIDCTFFSFIEIENEEGFNIYGINSERSFSNTYNFDDLKNLSGDINCFFESSEPSELMQFFFGTNVKPNVLNVANFYRLCLDHKDVKEKLYWCQNTILYLHSINQSLNYDNIIYFLYDNLYDIFSISLNTDQWELTALTLFKMDEELKEKKDSTLLRSIIHSLSGACYLVGKDENKAEQYLLESYQDFQEIEQKQVCGAYCDLVNNLAFIYNQKGNYNSAYKFALKACSLFMLKYGKTSLRYVNALSILADSEFGLNRTSEGLAHFEEVVNILENIPGIDNNIVQQYKAKLDYLYLRLNIDKKSSTNDSIFSDNRLIYEAINDLSQGNFESGKIKLKQLLDYYNGNFSKIDISNYVLVVTSLANVLASEGYYDEADNILNNALTLFQENNVQTTQVANIYNSKGNLYYFISNYETALHWYNQAKALYDINDNRSLTYASLISNMSLCYCSKHCLYYAKILSDEAYKICTDFYNAANDANDRLLILNNLATIYLKMKDYSKCKEIYKLIIESSSSKTNERTKALALMNLSEYYFLLERDYFNAEEGLKKVMELEADSHVTNMAEFDLYFLHCLAHNEKAITEIRQYNESVKDEMASMFAHFSEVERENYWTQKSQSLLALNNVAVANFDTPEVRTMAFDNALFTKNMLINSGRLLGNAVKDNQNVEHTYLSMQLLKNQLSDKRTPKDSISILVDKISLLEKQIVNTIPDFTKSLKSQFKTTADVKGFLSNSDVAIEFVFLPQMKFPLEDSKLQLGALILKKHSDSPTLIPLCIESELRDLFEDEISTNQDYVDKLYDINDTRLYKLLWAEIEPYLEKGSVIYYSPTGYISKISMSAISDGTHRLMDKYELHEVSTTAMIGELKKQKCNYTNAVLYGDINYYEDVNLMAENSKKYGMFSSGALLATRSLNRGAWDLLPATKDEIMYISKHMANKGIQTHIYTQNEANEESFKTISSLKPDLIHIATHGFYYSQRENISSKFFKHLKSYTQKDNSLLYSGLLFAGANNAWTGKSLEDGVEDGILTADEISHIDLSGNKLTVLSACSTGLGDIDEIDGVYGLQRAFKRAGANTLLISLWKVPDEETGTLMANFYEHLLSGKKPNQALRLAQNSLIKQGKSPFYWAGFVLLD